MLFLFPLVLWSFTAYSLLYMRAQSRRSPDPRFTRWRLLAAVSFALGIFTAIPLFVPLSNTASAAVSLSGLALFMFTLALFYIRPYAQAGPPPLRPRYSLAWKALCAGTILIGLGIVSLLV